MPPSADTAASAVDVSIVVPTWNHARMLGACIDSLLTQDHPSDRFEIVVVDDGSTDATADLIASYVARGDRPRVVAVRVPHGGLNRARNAGIEAARGAVVALMDDDEIAPRNHVARALTLLREHVDVDGVGGPAIDDGNGTVRTCSQCSLGTAVLNDNRPGTLPLLLGGNMFVNRDVFTRSGLFAPALSGRGDETEWFERVAGTYYYDPELLVWHRRDQFTLWQLCTTQFRQGRAVPKWKALRGEPFRPRWSRITRYLAHALRRRCGKGLIVAMRELGSAYEWGHSLVRRRTPQDVVVE